MCSEFNHNIQAQAHSFQQQLQVQNTAIGGQINQMSRTMQTIQSQIQISQEQNNAILLSKIEALFSPSPSNQVVMASPQPPSQHQLTLSQVTPDHQIHHADPANFTPTQTQLTLHQASPPHNLTTHPRSPNELNQPEGINGAHTLCEEAQRSQSRGTAGT